MKPDYFDFFHSKLDALLRIFPTRCSQHTLYKMGEDINMKKASCSVIWFFSDLYQAVNNAYIVHLWTLHNGAWLSGWKSQNMFRIIMNFHAFDSFIWCVISFYQVLFLCGFAVFQSNCNKQQVQVDFCWPGQLACTPFGSIGLHTFREICLIAWWLFWWNSWLFG